MFRSRLALVFVLGGLLCIAPGCASDQPANNMQTNLSRQELERRIHETQYLHGDELLGNIFAMAELGRAEPEALREGLASSDAHTRANVIYAIEMTGNRSHIPALVETLSDPSERVRYQAASTLVALGAAEGFPVLIEGLSSGNIRMRYKCSQALADATGRDFGYVHDASPDLRRAAVARWMDWLEEVRASAL